MSMPIDGPKPKDTLGVHTSLEGKEKKGQKLKSWVSIAKLTPYHQKDNIAPVLHMSQVKMLYKKLYI